MRDVAGRLVAVHERRDGADGPKRFIWRLPDGQPGLGALSVSDLPLYGSEKLAHLPPGAIIVLTEGEKAADALNRRGITALGTVTGASGTPGAQALRPLLAHPVVVWPDNDEVGRAHMERVGQRLHALGHRGLRVVEWAEAPPGGDAADFEGDDSALRALLEGARPYAAPPCDGAALLEAVRGFIRGYVILDDAQADAVALWTAHTWVLEAAESTAYLWVTSPEKRCGKTRLLEALAQLVARPWLTGRTSAAALVRKVAAEAPTLLLDESDAAFKDEREYAEALRGLLNAGHRRGGVASLCVKAGGDWRVENFPVFCPKAIAGIGQLPGTVQDRAIRILLQRRRPGEPIERFRWREAQEQGAPIRKALEGWAAGALPALAEARPDIPAELDDRAADGWEPLLAIADLAGGDWPGRARRAALALSAGDGREDESLGVQLLRDMRAIFQERGADRLTSAELVGALNSIEEAPWGDLSHRGLDARRLARMLRPYGVRPQQIRVGTSNLRGYERADFADPWERYMPVHTPEITATSATTATKAQLRLNLAGENVADVAVVADPGGIQKTQTPPCPHRPPGEVEDRWAHADGGDDPCVCACCGGPVRPDLWQGGLCPLCHNGRQPKEGSGHLARLALDLGATPLDEERLIEF